MSRCMAGSCLAALTATLCACASDAPIVEVKGDCGDAYQAQACTWAKVQGDQVIELGTTILVASIENAPKEQPMAWPPHAAVVLNLPESVRQNSGVTQFTMFWESTGHPPAPYLTPHFDFHFYLIPEAERVAIDCTDTTKPAALPAGYSLPDETLPEELAKMIGVSTLIGICVPQMGMHSLLTAEYESKETFRGTMVVGYYHGKPIFVEPMISRGMLLEKKSFDLPIPSIPGLSGPHPTVFRADYDAGLDAYRFVFSGFSPST